MESKLFQLTNWIEENKINISSVALSSINELIECGETSTSQETPHGISDWTVEVLTILKIFGIKFSYGNNQGKYVQIQDEQFLTECDYYIFEKEFKEIFKKANEIINSVNESDLILIESDNIIFRTYLSHDRLMKFDWLEVIRKMPDCGRKLADKEKINEIVNKY